MKTSTQLVTVMILLLGFAATARGAELVREFSGTTATTTVPFTVESPWILDWRLDADYEHLVALDVTLVDAKSGRHVGRVLHTKNKGNGVKLFRERGTYQLRISATLARWRIKIEQLSEAEAERYVPKQRRKAVF